MRATSSLYTLNRGIVSRLGLARLDVKRLALAAEVQTNWMPRVLGAMMLRPGRKYIGSTSFNSRARLLKFIFATNDTALLEMTPLRMRVWIADQILTRPSVTTAVTNGNFDADLTGWTSLDEAGAVSSWSAGAMQLLGTGTSYAIREQQVVVAPDSSNQEHGVRITILRGPVVVRIGSTTGGDDFLTETTLQTGVHSISITPQLNIWIRFSSCLERVVLVDSCTIEAAGPMTLPTAYAAGDLSSLRTDQSGDVVFVACGGHPQVRIERRGARPAARSWSVARYLPEDGPFKVLNVTPTTLTPSALTGNITLTASKPVFSSDQIGALYSIDSVGQAVTKTGAANGDATSAIRIVGVGGNRTFGIVIAGDGTGSTVDLQWSYDKASWTNVGGQHWTGNVSTTYADGLDNQIIYYRLILTTRVAPDLVVMALSFGGGSIRGVARITGYTSNLVVSAEVLSDMGQTLASTSWEEGMWSDKNGWPTAVRLHEGRLWWFGQNGIWGSISDAFDSFDETFIGNAGPLNRTIGSGPVDTINWGLSLKGLMIGTQGAEMSVRASSLDDPLTPTSFNVKAPSTQGSGPVDAVKVDQSGHFVNRSGTKVFDISFDLRNYDFQATDMMALAPDLAAAGITRIDVQRLPDTRLHCVLGDGTALVAITNKTEDVLCWVKVTTDGAIEDVIILPALDGDRDDQVYYLVKRSVNGGTMRHLEKWAQEVDCRGDLPHCYLADAFVHYAGVATTTISGLDHLEGKSVVVWADGADVGTIDTARPWTQRYAVSAGKITLDTAASDVVVGLPYTAQFKSAKLGVQAPGESPLNQQKNIDHVGLILADIHSRGLKYGPTLDDEGSLAMDDMPQIERGTEVGETVFTDYDENLIEFPGTWTTDSRVCLQAQAPRPATVLAITVSMRQNT